MQEYETAVQPQQSQSSQARIEQRHEAFDHLLGDMSRLIRDMEDGLYFHVGFPHLSAFLRKNGRWFQQHATKNKWVRVMPWDYLPVKRLEQDRLNGRMRRAGEVEDHPTPTFGAVSTSEQVISIPKGAISTNQQAVWHLSEAFGLNESMVQQTAHTKTHWVFALKPDYTLKRTGLLRKRRITKKGA